MPPGASPAVWRTSISTPSFSRWGSSPEITPFNFPAVLLLWMFADAVAYISRFVLKASEKRRLPAYRWPTRGWGALLRHANKSVTLHWPDLSTSNLDLGFPRTHGEMRGADGIRQGLEAEPWRVTAPGR